jgi:hypothetical protein
MLTARGVFRFVAIATPLAVMVLTFVLFALTLRFDPLVYFLIALMAFLEASRDYFWRAKGGPKITAETLFSCTTSFVVLLSFLVVFFDFSGLRRQTVRDLRTPGRWIVVDPSPLVRNSQLITAALAAVCVLVLAASYYLILHVLRNKRPFSRWEVVLGSLLLYLSTGLCGAACYRAIPGSLYTSHPHPLAPFDHVYFSFTCLSTTGFGDIHPHPDSQLAKVVSMVESFLGGYVVLGVFIAGALGLPEHLSGGVTLEGENDAAGEVNGGKPAVRLDGNGFSPVSDVPPEGGRGPDPPPVAPQPGPSALPPSRPTRRKKWKNR